MTDVAMVSHASLQLLQKSFISTGAMPNSRFLPPLPPSKAWDPSRRGFEHTYTHITQGALVM